MLTQLKEYLYRRRLEAETRSGKSLAAPVNLGNAKSIVVLFAADEAANRKAIDRWRDVSRKAGTTIRLVGYFHQDIGESDFGFPAITVRHLNWYGAPQGASVNAYRAMDCDILIRLGVTEHRELDFLAATKAAQIKVGPYQAGQTTPYHLQFDADRVTSVKDQLAAIERIFSFTNANNNTTI